MSSNPNHQKIVGTFLAIGLGVILFSIFLLGGNRQFLKDQVTMRAHFTEVQGLAEGSVVSLSGVNIGNVDKINFLPNESKLEVVMKIEASSLPRLTEGATASIRTQGALGDKFVFINPGVPGGKALSANEIVPTEISNDIMGVISSRGGEAAKLFDILNEIHIFTKTMNDNQLLGKLTEAASNLKLTAAESQILVQQLRSTHPEKLKQTFERLDSIMGKIDRGEGSLGALINDPSVHDQLKGMLGGDSKKKALKSLIRTSIEEK